MLLIQNLPLNGFILQILNWLSHCPTDMESYIRPGCVILTVYLRLPNWMWDEVLFYYINSALDMYVSHESIWCRI
jgi:hypothetical protein